MSIVVGAVRISKPDKEKTEPAKAETIKEEAEEKSEKKRTRKG